MSRPLRRLRLASPRTLLRWHAQLVARRWTYLRRQPGRPPTAQPIRGLVLRMARENPTGVYRRIQGELIGLGHQVATSTVWKILKPAEIDPLPSGPDRPGDSSWPRRPTPSSRSTPHPPHVLLAASNVRMVVVHGRRRVHNFGITPFPPVPRSPSRPAIY
jgi:hypothetical protein